MAGLRVLCIDIEGGSGGSSRSLLEFLRHMDRSLVDVEVWCRRSSDFVKRYQEMGIECRVVAELPACSTLPRFSRNLYTVAGVYWALWRRRSQLRRLAGEIEARFDLIHCNHEGLFLVARWLRRRVRIPFTMHVRTMCWRYGSVFGAWQAKVISKVTAACVFITENERDSFETAGGRSAGRVIYNPVFLSKKPSPQDPRIPQDGRFKIASLSNFAWIRGTDRLADLAETLVALGRRDILFVVAGHMKLPSAMTGEIGNAARRGCSFADYTAQCGIDDMFLFLGHVSNPEQVLAGCDLLIKPTREANPWGRDILEGLAAGMPVLTIGTYDRFVEDGVTGVLQDTFDAGSMADEIVALAGDRERGQRLGAAGRGRVADLCGGKARAADLAAFWHAAAKA